jgi:hypothetical protein
MHGCHPSIRSIKVVFACFRRNHFDPAPSISSEERQNIRSRAGSLRDKTSAATTRLLHLSLFNWCIYVALCIDPQLVVSIRQKACPATQVWVSACTLGGKLAQAKPWPCLRQAVFLWPSAPPTLPCAVVCVYQGQGHRHCLLLSLPLVPSCTSRRAPLFEGERDAPFATAKDRNSLNLNIRKRPSSLFGKKPILSKSEHLWWSPC